MAVTTPAETTSPITNPTRRPHPQESGVDELLAPVERIDLSPRRFGFVNTTSSPFLIDNGTRGRLNIGNSLRLFLPVDYVDTSPSIV
ncbi:hypothetical protein [Subtercola vilae]|uniref:Uncharacterized protein n=1 Tax=Subtercola vilae TaxID=2056433 RepID=A0A4T2BZN1_9MICO|nr:hypothetical protein [Subtercola vilae]TIH36171.1 hypothetical protein D4765_10370 [Subtercola vilae]